MLIIINNPCTPFCLTDGLEEKEKTLKVFISVAEYFPLSLSFPKIPLNSWLRKMSKTN